METLYDKASLILNPGVYDTGKVYCTKPFDGSGDLTFTRNSNATRVNADGLLEKVRTNYLLNTGTFSSWSLEGGTISGGFADPEGGTSAYKYVQSTGGLYSAVAFTDTSPKTMSVYLKSVDGTSYNVTLGDGATGGTVVTVTNTWQRLHCTYTSGSSRLALYVYGIGNAGGVLLWHPQGEISDFGPTPYIATTSAAVSVGPTANVPRLDYSGGATCPSLLLEPQRTNYFAYNEQIDNAAWAKVRTTVTANATTSPDGYQNADAVFVNSATNTNHEVFQYTTGSTNGWSGFFKANGYDFVYLFGSADPVVWFDLQNGVVGTQQSGVSGKITSYGNGWYRCEYFKNSGTNSIWGFGIVAANGSTTIGTPDTNKGVYFWGAQSEGTYATSYIGPTLGASVSRLVDSAFRTGVSSLIGQTEGTLYWEGYRVNSANFGTALVIDDTTTTNRIYILTTVDGFRIDVTSGGTSYAFYTATFSEGTHKIAVAYNSSAVDVYIDGVSVYNDTSVTIPACSRLVLGNWSGNTQESRTSQALLFKTRLTNAQLAELTTL